VVTTVGIMIIGFVIPYIPPLQRALAFARPANSFVGFLLAELVLYCVEVQLVKMVYIRIFKAWL
jgi:P-type Mg2+ transporter